MRNDETYNQEQIDLLWIQIIAACLFLLTVIISIVLSYDKILSLSHQKRLFSDAEAKKLSYINSVLIIIIVIIYLYVGYGNIMISKAQGKNSDNLYLLEFNSVLALIAAFVGYYVVTHDNGNGLPIADTEV